MPVQQKHILFVAIWRRTPDRVKDERKKEKGTHDIFSFICFSCILVVEMTRQAGLSVANLVNEAIFCRGRVRGMLGRWVLGRWERVWEMGRGG